MAKHIYFIVWENMHWITDVIWGFILIKLFRFLKYRFVNMNIWLVVKLKYIISAK